MTVAAPAKPKKLRLDWGSLTELPRQMGVALEDLKISGNEYATLIARAKAGDSGAMAKLEMVKNVLFELMRRDPRDEHANLRRNDFGELVTVEEHTLSGRIKTPTYELDPLPRSRWGIAEGPDTHIGGAGEGRVRPKAGHWKTQVETHWLELAPLLKFRSKDVRAPKGDPLANPDAYKAAVEWSLDNENPDRIELKKWLDPFLKAGAPSSWDGQS